VVRAVDAARHTITFDDKPPPAGTFTNNGPAPPELAGKTFPVARDANITVDDRTGTLAGVVRGALVALSLSADGKTVRGLQGYGPGWGRVVIKAVDVARHTLTFDDDNAPEPLAGRTFPVAKDASIQIDDRPGTLAEVPPGVRIDVGMSVDQKTISSFRVVGLGWTGVFVKAVDAGKGTITFDGDKAPPELAGKTLPLARDASVQIDCKPGRLVGLPPGARIAVSLSADQKAVRSLQATGPGWQGVFVKAVDAARDAITFDDDKAPEELAGKTLPLAKDAEVRLDGKPGTLAGVLPGARVDLAVTLDQKAVRTIQADGPGWQGVFVEAVDAAKGTITFDGDKAPPELAGKTLPLARDAEVMIRGSRGRLAAVRPGAPVNVALTVDKKSVRSIQAGP
jgi:uncharacterized protein (DUF4415 family)